MLNTKTPEKSLPSAEFHPWTDHGHCFYYSIRLFLPIKIGIHHEKWPQHFHMDTVWISHFFAEKRVMRKIQFALHEIPDLNKFFPQPTDIISNITYHAKPQIVHIVPKIHSFHWFQVQLLLYYESDQMKAIQSIIDFCCCCPFLPSRNCLQFSISLPIWFIVCNLALRCRW